MYTNHHRCLTTTSERVFTICVISNAHLNQCTFSLALKFLEIITATIYSHHYVGRTHRWLWHSSVAAHDFRPISLLASATDSGRLVSLDCGRRSPRKVQAANLFK